ncbi:MAG TPA: lipid-A-disaccharide synthase [Rhodanobacteraceae bacterium]|nr:lipid-A-disaccharide synthase [Rhodanobacteraceae bacterium]
MSSPHPESRIPNPGFPNPGSPRFALVAGETSGDLLGGGLIAALRERFPKAAFAGVGGPRMQAAGLETWHAADELAVMGLAEVVKHLPRLLALRRDVRRRVLAFRPDVFIGVDAPDFNFGLERKLKASGVRTVHYVSPSIWAWRAKRARKIGRSTDLVLCLFPFEPAIYAQHGVNAVFVGHPLADTFALDPVQAPARAALDVPDDVPVLALLPGSRLGEIRRLAADFIGAARRLQAQLPNLRVLAPMANAACRLVFEAELKKAGFGIRDSGFETAGTPNDTPASNPESRMPNPVTLLDGHAHDAMIAADAVLLASGTAALEAMLAKRPMVVAYRIAPLTYRIVTGFKMLQTERYSLPNVLAGRDLVPELMQDACTPDALAEALLPALRDRRPPLPLLAEYRHLHLELRRDASRSAATAIAGLIGARHQDRAP